DIAALEEALFAQAFAEGGQSACGRFGIAEAEISHHRHRLLRARHQRPKKRWRGRRAAEKRDELAPAHSTTSSARSRKDSGIVSLMALAVLRLTMGLNLVGCSTGRSPAFSPLRMRPT